MSNPLDLDVLWGGYYASIPKDGSGISVFRLLDFTRDAYHAALYGETFTTMPALDDLVSLAPWLGHAPIALDSLLNEDDVQLIGGKPLSLDDLEGYLYYLEDFGVSEAERNQLVQSLLAFSQSEPPIKLRLELVDNELQMTERDK
ncbi:hypothetical protein [Vacuolonema iberomarrocanum]|uniref:hypothetical protein n=1 Tax=Vacuolonema iberomarrocanum TaxID=3454632 RepID=UPI001A081A5B|nr:hypothetical protein [filamentous cyanobacterium LEGE 07170]